jgi:subtilase family serine protease
VFYVVVKADGDNAVGETSETNNTSSRQIAVGPDLVISTASAPGTVVAGSTITVTDTVLNQGADGAVATSTRFYLSRNTTLDATDIALDALRDVPAIAAGASSAGTTSVVIPATTPAAFYYLLVKADGDNGVGESYETNNVMVRTMWVTAAP